MANEKGFRIEVSCRHEPWRDYDVALLCGCFDDKECRIGTVSARTADPQSAASPAVACAGEAGGTARLEIPACHHALLYLYIIPRKLPEGNDIEALPPFDATLKILRGSRTLHTERLKVNRWSGLSREFRIENPE